MKILRPSETELVVEENSVWITVLLALASLPILSTGMHPGSHGNLGTGVFFLLCALLFLRHSTFVFDGARQVVRWKRLRLFRTSSGEIPFRDITAINMDCTTGRLGSSRKYRLTLSTRTASFPLSDRYSSGRAESSSRKEAIQQFIRPELSTPLRQQRLRH